MQEFRILNMDSTYGDLNYYDPRLDPHNFEVWNEWEVLITFTIGYDQGGHLYDLYVCSKEWVDKYMPMWGKFLLIVPDWDIKEIIHQVNLIIKECTADTPEKTFKNLSRYMFWEFDNYQP
ncbi:Imm8 family immunity protein [Campylobacter majalis]|uniref:Imm8 family immunity protein n=1 Tax=Campylobacter majalis TaxID=2790656 RepID=UPI003D6803D9